MNPELIKLELLKAFLSSGSPWDNVLQPATSAFEWILGTHTVQSQERTDETE